MAVVAYSSADERDLERRIDHARAVLNEVRRVDRSLRNTLRGHSLRYLGIGVSTVVFALGPERVVKLTLDADSVDCDVPMDLLEDQPRGARNPGWPRIYDVVTLTDDEDRTACIVIAERVKPISKLSGTAERLLADAADVVATYHVLRSHDPATTLEEVTRMTRTPMTDRSRAWMAELYRGLLTIDRFDDNSPIDIMGDNVGLTKDDHAVWLDFGV